MVVMGTGLNVTDQIGFQMLKRVNLSIDPLGSGKRHLKQLSFLVLLRSPKVLAS